jgi:ABC-type glycerol-3-phosphate transport system substrate-binding protein
LAELSEVMDSVEAVLPNIRAASQTADGKLYAIPCGMRIPLAYADGDASQRPFPR